MSTLNVTTVAATNIRASSIQDTGGNNGSTPAAIANGIAKAWVNFNGTGTVAIRASFNVSSITDNGTGDYTVNFTTAMPDENYAAVGMCARTTFDNRGWSVGPLDSTYLQAGSVRLLTLRDASEVQAGALSDSAAVSVTIFR